MTWLLRARCHLGRALVVVAVCLAPRSAGAQEPSPPLVLPPIRVTAPAPLPDALPREWVPATVDILTDRDVRAERGRILPDALERFPGVTLQNEQGTPYQPDLSVRGFFASPVTGVPQGVSVFLDGVRLNEPTVEEVHFNLIPLDDAELVEVIRGPSVLFGRNTLGAAVNIVTRRGGERLELVPEISGGSFGQQNYRLRVGGTARPFDYYASVGYSREIGWREVSETRIGRTFTKLGLRAGDLTATLSYQYSNDRIEQAGSLPQSLAIRRPVTNLTGGDFFAPTLHLAIVNAGYAATPQVTMESNAFVRVLEAEQFNVNLLGDDTRLFTRTLSIGGRLQGSHRGQILGRDNVLIVGVEYTRSRVTSRTVEEGDEGPSVEADLADVQDAGGAYIQDTLTLWRGFLGPRSSLVLTAAGRWDYLRHRIDDRLGGPSGGAFTFSRFNPRAGVNLNLSERVGFFASYGEGFRAPAFLELTCAGPGAVCPGLQAGVAPDPPLNPVVARTYEIGAYARPFAWLDLDVSAYRTDVSNEIYSVSPTGTVGLFFQNVGATRREGIEIGLRARASHVEAFANYTYTRATFRDLVELATPLPSGNQTVTPGRSFALVPEHRLNAGLAWHPWRWATLSVGLLYVGPSV